MSTRQVAFAGALVGVLYAVTLSLRGDVAPVTIGRRVNVQDGVVVHCDTDVPNVIEDDVTIDFPLEHPVVSGVRTAAGTMLAAADGGVFTFGDARFHGSLGAAGSASTIIGLLADADADGYWLVGENGTSVRF